MAKYLYSPWASGVTNYEQKNTKLMDKRFFGAAQPQMEVNHSVVSLRYSPGKNILGKITATDRLYILAHCEPGSKAIESGFSGSQLDAAQVAARLKENGLVDRKMAVKLYACSGGRGKLFSPSFAQRLVSALRHAGYKSISVQAYTRTVTQKSKDGDEAHKWALDDKGNTVGRASDFRKTFK